MTFSKERRHRAFSTVPQTAIKWTRNSLIIDHICYEQSVNGTPVALGPLPGDAKALRDPCSSLCASRAPRRPRPRVQSLNSECHPCRSPSLNRYGSHEKRTTRKLSRCCPYHPFLSVGRAPEVGILDESERLNRDVAWWGKVAAAGRPHPTLGSTDQREECRRPDLSPDGAQKTCETSEHPQRPTCEVVELDELVGAGCPRPTPASTDQKEGRRRPPHEMADAAFCEPAFFAEAHVSRISAAE
jgi:hypothetical protein